jgi:hypothetical protein
MGLVPTTVGAKTIETAESKEISNQCSGSASGSVGTICFWASRIRIQILPFSHKSVERSEVIAAKLSFNTKIFRQNI